MDQPDSRPASYHSLEPRRITGEVEDWVGHSPEQLRQMKDNLARLNSERRAEIIED
jgi:rifampin ADP-ribosylating transferase